MPAQLQLGDPADGAVSTVRNELIRKHTKTTMPAKHNPGRNYIFTHDIIAATKIAVIPDIMSG